LLPKSAHRFTAVSAGIAHSLALAEDGTVWAWGSNYSGQLGDGTTTNSASPVQVRAGGSASGGFLSSVTAISAGGLDKELSFSLALKADGTVWAWGSAGGSWHFLGSALAPPGQSSEPIQVQAPPGIKAIDAGGTFSLALTGDGTVLGWGRSYATGELGVPMVCVVGTEQICHQAVPVPIPGMSGVKAISAGGTHSLALKTDGTLWAWGFNNYGQLGTGKATVDPSRGVPPSPVTGLAGKSIISLSAGASHSLVATENGEVWAWGRNESGTDCDPGACGGQVGDGSTVSQPSPVKVIDAGAVAVSAGKRHSLALLTGGRTAGWGGNEKGQLGDGSTIIRETPTSVPVPAAARSVSAGGLHSLAILAPKPVVATLLPPAGSAAGGTSVTITGTDFDGLGSVNFGGVVLACGSEGSAQCWPDAGQPGNSVHVLAPPHAPGAVSVVVKTDGGDSLPGSFVYYPEIKGISPSCGPVTGGTTLNIRGMGLAQASSVGFEGSASAAPVVVSDAEITVVTPPSSLAVPARLTVLSNGVPSPLPGAPVFSFSCNGIKAAPPGDPTTPVTDGAAGGVAKPASVTHSSSAGPASAGRPTTPGNPPPTTVSSSTTTAPSATHTQAFSSSVSQQPGLQVGVAPAQTTVPSIKTAGASRAPFGAAANGPKEAPAPAPHLLFSALDENSLPGMAFGLASVMALFMCGLSVKSSGKRMGAGGTCENGPAVEIAY